MTRNGIVYNLEESPYNYTLYGITYYFSSTNHKLKFMEEFKQNRIILELSLERRFGVEFNVKQLADLHLYSRIETRGFLIQLNEVYHTCKKTIILGGDIKTKQS